MQKSKLFFLILSVLCFNTTVFSQEGSKRIISLSPALTEEIYLLGIEDKLVGCTIYCKRPPSAQKKEKVGNVVEVNVEKIISLRPDLVLATELTDPKDIEKLKALGISVINFPTPRNFSEICEGFLRLARIVRREQKAKEIVEEANKEIETIKEMVKDLPKPKVFVQIGARPLFTVTKDSFIHNLIELAGGINIASSAKTGLYSRENVIRKDPDVIIIASMGITGKKEKKHWEAYKTLKAVKGERIYFIDASEVCSPTPLSFVEALKEIVELIHPEIKKDG